MCLARVESRKCRSKLSSRREHELGTLPLFLTAPSFSELGLMWTSL